MQNFCQLFLLFYLYKSSIFLLPYLYLFATLIELRTAHTCSFAPFKLMPHPRLALTQKPSLFEIL